EGSWTHLHNILINTDNHDLLPTNRPLHTTLHFVYRLQNIKKIEFQNHGTAHLHGVYWTTTSILEMINLNTI
ncbi:10986_t:CDS:2, partial [Dentiscutata heterogama]